MEFYIGDLVYLPVFAAHYGESPYRSGCSVIFKICMVTGKQTVFSPLGPVCLTNIA